jgi:hypothetical protein
MIMTNEGTKTPTIQIELSYPVRSDGTELRVLQLRRPKVKDQLLVSKQGGTEEEKEVRLFANLCEVTPETIQDMDMEDYRKLQDTYVGFFDSK